MKEKLFLAIFSLVTFALLSFAFFQVYYFPSPKEEKKNQPPPELNKIATKSAFEYEINVLNRLPEVYEKHKRSLAQLPTFSPPEDNRLTPEQIDKYWITYHTCAEMFEELREEYLKQIKIPFAKALATAKYGRWVFSTCVVKGLDLAQMTEEEFDWVKTRVWESALFVVNCLVNNSPNHPQRELLIRTQERLCQLLHLDEEEKEGDKYCPERLNLKNIPRSNIELVLDKKDKVHWQDVPFDRLDIDPDLVMKCARQLLEE